MQEFASKASRWAGVLNHELNCLKSRKLVRIMKITAVILLGACLQLSARGLSQTITLSVKDAPLRTVFKSIEKQTDFAFFFDEELLRTAKRVTVNASNLPLTQVLEICFKEQPFTYTISGNTITLVRNRQKLNASNTFQIQNANPPIDVKGRVINANGEPIADATVSIKGSTKRTITNANGEFTFNNVNDDAVVVISHVQYETLTVLIKGKELVNAILQFRVSSLDELQVIAYGTTTKRFSTGNISSVKAKDIELQPISNPLLALQGRVTGLNITQSTGLPGSGLAVRLQGQNTISALVGNDPLYIVDGVPYPSRQINSLSIVQGSSGGYAPNQVIGSGLNTPAGNLNPLNYINPQDIESIEVLKDADATAIYGTRAANGAILITTKKGKAGKTKVDLNVQKGFGKVSNKIDIMNTQQYLEMRYEALSNDGLKPDSAFDYDLIYWDQDRYTDWQKVLIGGTANYTDLNMSISGGNANTQFTISPGYKKESTVFPGNKGSTSTSLHFNINNTSNNQRFNIQLTTSFFANNTNLGDRDLTLDAIRLAPNAPALYNTDGTINWASLPNGDATWDNPLARLNQEFSNKTLNLISNANLSYRIFRGLTFRSTFGYTILQSDQYVLRPWSSIMQQNRSNNPRTSTFTNSDSRTWIVEPQLTYNTELVAGKLEVLVGASAQRNDNTLQAQGGLGYNNDAEIKNITAAPTKSASTAYSIYKYNAGFGRINYNWKNKYIINFNIRQDASSRFGKENQTHAFSSIGGAWIFSEEPLLKRIKFLSFGKLKASYGITGNDQIGNYQYLDLYTTIPALVTYQNTIGYTVQNLANPYLQWENNKKLSLGFDIGLLKDNILLSAIYAKNRSSNQLLGYSLPIITGFTSINMNFPALVQNESWEITLSTKNISNKKFLWSSDINLTIPQNKLLKFQNLESSSYANSLVIGEPISISKTSVLAGVNPMTGLYEFYDKDGNIVNTPTFTDKTKILKAAPKFYGGFQNQFKYKNLAINFLFQFTRVLGIDKHIGYQVGTFVGIANLGNQPISVLQRWQKSGDITPIQKYSTLSDAVFSNLDANESDAVIADASFIRLKNLSISYTVPNKIIKSLSLNKVIIYTSAQNLLTITRYKGLDPETGSDRLPPLRMLSFGIRCSL